MVLLIAGCEMGSGGTTNRLGLDPEAAQTGGAGPDGSADGPGVWLNIDGPTTPKSQGDRYTSEAASNVEYDRSGAWYRVRVTTAVSAEPLVISAFDPAYVYVGDRCGYGGVSAAQVPAVALAYPDDPLAAARYAPGVTGYCTGDGSSARFPEAMTTTYIVRAPDETPLDREDNPVICAISFSPRSGPFFSQLVTPDGRAATTPVGALDQLPLSAVFRQHVDICTVPPGSVAAGEYLVQVRSNAAQPALLPPTVVADPGIDALARSTVALTDSAVVGSAHNRFSLRAGLGADPSAPGWGDGVWTSAEDRLAVYSNLAPLNQATVVPVYRVPSFGAGQTLHLELWDAGDGADVTLTIEAPPDSNLLAPTCSWARNGGPIPATAAVDGCTITGVEPGNFNAAVLSVDIALPEDYRCADADISGCFFRASTTFTYGTPNDTTTWTSNLVP